MPTKEKAPPSIVWPDSVRARWFYPVVAKVEAFEESANVFSFIESAVSPSSPEWVAQCLVKSVKPYWDQSGFSAPEELDARRIGAHLGAKSAVMDTMKRNHEFARMWSDRQRRSWTDVFGEDVIAEAEAEWERFAKTLSPAFKKICRFAINLAEKQPMDEQIQFYQGLSKGKTFMNEVRKNMKKASTKAEKDEQTRMVVYFFAVCSWEFIEEHRSSLTWMKLAEMFDEVYDHKVAIDEETFTKILRRCGLRIGTVGRPRSKS